jgi:hypothetical protein
MEDMKSASVLERWIIGVLDILLLALAVFWLSWIQFLQINFILVAGILGVFGVLSAVAWRHGFRWCFSRRALRFYAWLIVGILSVIVLFFAEERWRGKRAWAALQRETAARGESLELSSVFPPPVTEDQNFAMAPGVRELMGPKELPFYHGTRDKWPTFNWALQQSTDLAAWQTYFRRHPLTNPASATGMAGRLTFPVAPEPQSPAADIMLALSRYDSDLAVLRAADQRPKVRYPLAYEDGWLALDGRQVDPADNLYAAVHILCLRAVAELAQDQGEAALRDTLLALRLANSLRQEPYARLHTIRSEMLVFCLQPVWEGLARHRWNEAQLRTLQQRFAEMDLLSDFRVAARGETILMMNLADQLHAILQNRRSAAGDRLNSSAEGERFWVWFFRLVYPIGWFYQDKAWMYRFYERRADALKAVDPANEAHLDAELLRVTDPLLLVMVVPRLRETFSDGASKALFLQTACQEAMVACALERCRLAQGQYPASLDALVPAYLKQVPADLLGETGAPLKYRQEPNGGFVLYSIGLNRVDDHGKSVGPDTDWRGAGACFPRLDEGDWIWSQPGKLQ